MVQNQSSSMSNLNNTVIQLNQSFDDPSYLNQVLSKQTLTSKTHTKNNSLQTANF
jgi:hypothetical protein